jgi:hypothetical protein
VTKLELAVVRPYELSKAQKSVETIKEDGEKKLVVMRWVWKTINHSSKVRPR